MINNEFIVVDNVPYLVVDSSDEWNLRVIKDGMIIKLFKWIDGKYRFEREGQTKYIRESFLEWWMSFDIKTL